MRFWIFFINLLNFKMLNKHKIIVKLRISIIFMLLRSKLTSELCQEVVSLDEKTEQNRLKVATLPPFFFKKLLYLLKNKKHY